LLEHQKINQLDDYFCPLNSRRTQSVYVYRINGYNPEIKAFIRSYYDTARKNGVVIEGGIPNPTNQNLAYYQEQMGAEFRMSRDFIENSLKKWLPRMSHTQCQTVAESVFRTLDMLREAGKPESVLKNVYIKFMCWLYYKFERIINQLGIAQLPKILYEGDITNHELLLISVLAYAGCDVVFLQYHGDANYLKYDPESKFSENLTLPGMNPFPEGFSLKQVRQEIQEELSLKRLYGALPEVRNATNIWLENRDNLFEKIRSQPGTRGSDPKLFYNCYCRISGVEQKQSYPNDLYQLYSTLKNSGRRVIALDTELPLPTPQEVDKIQRLNVTKTDALIQSLAVNLKYPANPELQKLMNKSFVDVMTEESHKPDMNLNKLSSQAVSLLCWLKRYQADLFQNWKMPETSCFLYLGGCRNEKEAMFFRFLARLPVDILILTPDLNQKCCLEDDLLYEQHFSESLSVTHYPKDMTELRVGTAAYHAERELDTLLYQDSGLYRNQQYSQANAVTLQTTYHEIFLYWKEEVSMRPNFGITDGVVTLPVLFAKISGVEDGDIPEYIENLKRLMPEAPFLVGRAPYIDSRVMNPLSPYIPEFLNGNRLQREKIVNHPRYLNGFLRPEIQKHLFDKLQLLIDGNLIQEIPGKNLTVTIVSTILNLDREIMHRINQFDFTKKNPKFIYIAAGENMMPSAEDAIVAAFLNLVGFDVLFFVPTGYQCVEKYFRRPVMQEHIIGEFRYNVPVRVMDLNRCSGKPYKENALRKLFKRKR